MRIGRQRHRATIERSTETRNAVGEVIRTWSLFAERWMAIEPLTGRELWNAQQVQPDVTHRVRMRQLDGVTTDMRIDFNGRILHIRQVLDREERGIEQELLCVERV